MADAKCGPKFKQLFRIKLNFIKAVGLFADINLQCTCDIRSSNYDLFCSAVAWCCVDVFEATVVKSLLRKLSSKLCRNWFLLIAQCHTEPLSYTARFCPSFVKWPVLCGCLLCKLEIKWCHLSAAQWKRSSVPQDSLALNQYLKRTVPMPGRRPSPCTFFADSSRMMNPRQQPWSGHAERCNFYELLPQLDDLDALFSWQPVKPRWACPEHIMVKWAGPSNAG